MRRTAKQGLLLQQSTTRLRLRAMLRTLCSGLLGGMLLVAPPIVLADPLDGLEMDVIGADERPEDAARRIELPEAARAHNDGEDGAALDRDTATEAREHGAEFGQETAEQARERQGPPENIGRPDNAGPPGEDNRPENPGNDNRPGGSGPSERGRR